MPVELVILPRAFLEAACEVDQLADATPGELLVLAIVNAAVGVQQQTNGASPVLSELTLVYSHRWNQQQPVLVVELVALELAYVNPAGLPHDLRSLVPEVILPDALEAGAISPDHLAMAFSLAIAEVAEVLGYLVLDTLLLGPD